MNAEQFAMWAQGMLEYRDVSKIDPEEALKMLQGIKDHVALVFKKVTPKLSKADEALNDLIKNASKNIKPEYPQSPMTPLPYFPTGIPLHDYERKGYWLGSRGEKYKPGELYC